METDEEKAFAEDVRAFVRAECPESVRSKVVAAERVTSEERRAWHAALYRRGWAAPHWPVEYGGTGWSAVQTYIFAETLAEEGAPDLSAFGLKMLAPTLMRYGTEDQKRRYLPRILSGEDFWCQGYSEPGSGSDLVSLKTRAEFIDDQWVVNGQKMWTTMAHEANMMFALVRTDPAAPKPQLGVSMLLIELDHPRIGPALMRLAHQILGGNAHILKEHFVGGALAIQQASLPASMAGSGYSSLQPNRAVAGPIAASTGPGPRTSIFPACCCRLNPGLTARKRLWLLRSTRRRRSPAPTRWAPSAQPTA